MSLERGKQFWDGLHHSFLLACGRVVSYRATILHRDMVSHFFVHSVYFPIEIGSQVNLGRFCDSKFLELQESPVVTYECLDLIRAV